MLGICYENYSYLPSIDNEHYILYIIYGLVV